MQLETNSTEIATRNTEADIFPVLKALASIPQMFRMLQEQSRQIASLREEIARTRPPFLNSDCWLDAKGAAEYLGMSAGTFDKYRYQGDVRITGYRVGGKTLYKRLELDSFVKLWEPKSSGLA